MPRINLLPWRAALREKRKKDFMVAILAAVLFGGLVVYSGKLFVEHQVSEQNARNQLLQGEISKLDKKIAQISDLETRKKQLIARMKIIDQLQRSRPEVVHLFDELVNIVPDGVYLTSVKQTGKSLVLVGHAQSSTRVSALMRNIDESKWLEKPLLDVVKTIGGTSGYSQFTIRCQEVTITDQDDGAKVAMARKS